MMEQSLFLGRIENPIQLQSCLGKNQGFWCGNTKLWPSSRKFLRPKNYLNRGSSQISLCAPNAGHIDPVETSAKGPVGSTGGDVSPSEFRKWRKVTQKPPREKYGNSLGEWIQTLSKLWTFGLPNFGTTMLFDVCGALSDVFANLQISTQFNCQMIPATALIISN